MPEPLEMKNIVENILSSYEDRIHDVSSIIEGSHQILEDFQDSILDTKEEREKINTQLRDILARNESLRRKDFDNMMRGILSTQDEREKEVRNLLKGYLKEHKNMVQELRVNLGKFKDSLARGEVERVKEFHEMIKETLAKQDERKDEVTSRLKEFQKEQKVLASRLKELLAKGRVLRIRDLKLMLREFKTQHKERVARQQERREEVRRMLCDFKKKGKQRC
jgi:molecular chaperone DnaK (HSP70)